MKKKYLNFFHLIILIINSSCSEDKIEELYAFEDNFIEITALLNSEKTGEEFNYHISYLETGGQKELIEVNNIDYSATIRKAPITFADKIINGYAPDFSSTSIEHIKQYKKVGVILKSIKNVTSFNIIISDIHTGSHLINLDIDLKEEIKFIYDFNNQSYLIE